MAEKTKPSWLVVAAAVAIILAAGVFYVVKDNGAEAGIDPDDGAKVALGARLYADNCASCIGRHIALVAVPDQRRRMMKPATPGIIPASSSSRSPSTARRR